MVNNSMTLNSDYARVEFSFITYKLTSFMIYKLIIINK